MISGMILVRPKSFDSFAILSSRNDSVSKYKLITHAIFFEWIYRERCVGSVCLSVEKITPFQCHLLRYSTYPPSTSTS